MTARIRVFLGVSAIALAVACRAPDPAGVKAEAVRRGSEALERRDYSGAVSGFQEAVAADPRDGDVRLRLAHAHFGAQQWPEAARQALIAADLMPANRDVQRFAISMVLLQSRFSDVLVRTEALLNDEPDDVPVLVMRGNAMARLLHPTWAMEKVEEAWRGGMTVARATSTLRPHTAPADDERAQQLFRRALELAPRDPEAQLAFVNHLWAMGKLDEAEGALRRMADQNPGHVFANRLLGSYYGFRSRAADAEKYLKVAAATGDRDARTALALLYARGGRAPEALAMFEALIAAGDTAGDLAVRAAAMEIALGRVQPALARLDRVLAKVPRHGRALERRAEVLFAGRQLDLAAASAEAAVAADPSSATAHRLLGRVLTARGDLDRAFDQYAEALWLDASMPDVPRELAGVALALRRDGAAVEYARQALRHDPGDRAAAVALVSGLVGVRDYATADKTLKPLLAREPNAPDLLLQAGRIQEARGDRAQARSTFQRVLQAEPDSVDALSGLVSLDLAEGQPLAARARVNAARTRRPNDTRLMVLSARASAAARDVRDAESTLRALIHLEPANVEASVLLAEILAGQNQIDPARRVLDEVIVRRPASVEARLALGRLFEGTGQRAEAIGTYEQLLAAQPRTPVAAYRLARLYVAGNERLEQALELARGARQALPDDPEAGDVLGWIYVKQGLITRAVPHLEEAVRRAPAEATYRYHLGVAYLRLGRHAQARAELLRALEIDPAFDGAADARASLAAMSSARE